MAYLVDRVVVCDAFAEPTRHYEILPGGRSKLVEGRRPSKGYVGTAADFKNGLKGLVGSQATLLDEQVGASERLNESVNAIRGEVREWRDAGYPGTADVTRRLLEWWFERDEERLSIGRRFFFCQQEAIETVIYLYEAQSHRRMPETGDLLRYALKLATGTGKTVVMALLVTWSTLHKRKVSGSPLSANFLVLVPNLTVKDRVSGQRRGDGLDPAGSQNLYGAFDIVPPELIDDFSPNVMVRNWQGIQLEAKRDDWLPEDVISEGRFIPASVLRAMQRRAKQDPNAGVHRLLKGWRDLMVINDEAHHVYGEKKSRKGEEAEHIKWSKILERVSRAARVGLVVDLSATPWYGSGSSKPEGTLFEWLVSDFSVYDAFESGLVKVVRLPEQTGPGSQYIDLWALVKGAKTANEYLSACKGAIASIYSSWKDDFGDWEKTFEVMRHTPSPVLLCVADNTERAKWLFDHLVKDYSLLGNQGDEVRKWVTIQVDRKVFEADSGKEAVLRDMVSTVGKKGMAGERVRCIVSVNMLSEGWDVQSVSHIIGVRAFGSPLLTEQIIGRGLRRTNYDVLNEPLDKRPEYADETVDAFGIPFIGFPVQKRKRPKAGSWGQKPVWIEPDRANQKHAMRVPNVRSWAVGVVEPLRDLIRVAELPAININPRETPAEVRVAPPMGGKPEAIMTLEGFRREWPLLKTAFRLAQELLEATTPDGSADGGTGPTFDELLDVVRAYLDTRVTTTGSSAKEDVGIYDYRMRVRDILENAVRSPLGDSGTKAVPIPGKPEHFDSVNLRRFQWSGIIAEGKKCHLNKVPCHTDLEKQFVEFLDAAPDVIRYLKNERFGFSVTYFEGNRPRQYYPDFIVTVREADGREVNWLAETKGEIRPNTALKRKAAEAWCDRMSSTSHGPWRSLFVPQRHFEAAKRAGVPTFAKMIEALVVAPKGPQLNLIKLEDPRIKGDAFKSLLPLYTMRAAAGYFGEGQTVEPEAWVEVDDQALDEKMFVARAIGRSMEPTIHDGDFIVFRSNPVGSRHGKIVLAQYRGPADPDTGGAFTVKKYTSEKQPDATGGWRHTRVVLSPLNRDYQPIVIPEDRAEDFKILAEYVTVLGR